MRIQGEVCFENSFRDAFIFYFMIHTYVIHYVYSLPKILGVQLNTHAYTAAGLATKRGEKGGGG